MPEPEWSRANRWLTVVLITPEAFGVDREQVRLALGEEDIEARPVWKPMHLQPVFTVAAQSLKLKAERDEKDIQNPKPKTTRVGLLGEKLQKTCLRGGCVCHRVPL